MDGEIYPGEPASRPPNFDDLLSLCRELNRQGARYVVIGGMAIQHLGFLRTTGDVDLRVDDGPENIARIKRAMASLPDNAARLIDDTDVIEHGVVRISDEIMVDLLGSACGVRFSEAESEGGMVSVKIADVLIPYATATLMMKTKQTYREKDALDRVFLARKIADEKGHA